MKRPKAPARSSRIEVVNLNEDYSINEKFLKKIVASILTFIKRPKDTELEIVFLNNKTIRDFNKRYRGENRATDVLSFKIEREEASAHSFIGEILISSEMAFRNSAIFKTGFCEELVLYVIHGILHLFGYDDEVPGKRLVMSRREKEILDLLCRKEDLSKVLMPR